MLEIINPAETCHDPSTARVVQVLLASPEGYLILQRRDNNPGIANPGMVAPFGGAVDPRLDVTLEDAAIREVFEETWLALGGVSLRNFGMRKKTQAKHGEDSEVHYFLAENVVPERLLVCEGVGHVVIHGPHELDDYPLTPLAREVSHDYFETQARAAQVGAAATVAGVSD